MPKRCSGPCHQTLDESCFNKNKSKKDGLNTICKECSRLRSKKYYKDNPDKHKQRVKERNQLVYSEVKTKIKEIKLQTGCSFCSESEPCCLDFHHINPYDKTSEVSALARDNCWARVKKEIDKCILLCANCHRKLHQGIIKLSGS